MAPGCTTQAHAEDELELVDGVAIVVPPPAQLSPWRLIKS